MQKAVSVGRSPLGDQAAETEHVGAHFCLGTVLLPSVGCGVCSNKHRLTAIVSGTSHRHKNTGPTTRNCLRMIAPSPGWGNPRTLSTQE